MLRQVRHEDRPDVIPALEAGAWAVYVPHEHTWLHEHADEPDGAPRYRRIADLAGLAAIVEEAERG